MVKILIATGNPGKFNELKKFFSNLPVSFLSLKNFPKTSEPEENFVTFSENALKKAKFFAQKFETPTISEDSGIFLESFPEKFGVKTRREIPEKDDQIWLKKFLELLHGQKNRKAIFFSAIAFFDPIYQKNKTCLGKISGEILEKPASKIEIGVPISAVFLPKGEKKVFSAMSKQEKNKISHRGKSAQKMIKFLQTYLKNSAF